LSRHISGINKLIAPFIIMLFDAVIVDDSIQLVLDSPRTDEVVCNFRRSCSCLYPSSRLYGLAYSLR